MEDIKDKIIKIIEDKNGSDIKIYDLQGKSPFYDYSILCTGSSNRNVEAITIELKKEIGNIRGIEGLEEANWVLIDANDIIINIFQEDARNYYKLDEFYDELLK